MGPRLIGGVGFVSQLPDVEGFLGVFLPDGVGPDAEVVLIVDEEVLQAGAGDVGELVSVSVDVWEALLPSAMFCLPVRAALIS